MNRLIAPLILVFVLSSWSNAQDWPALRGESGYGELQTNNGILTQSTDVSLKTRWKKKLGSGYSSVVVANNKVVTMYTDGTSDFVACLNAANGDSVWNFKTGPMFKGENGSFDGPISTPLIESGMVYALSAQGTLFCIDLESGEQVWSTNLPELTGVKQPLYGFVTSPVMAAETLIVQVGAADKAIMGFDPKTGEARWAVGSDSINSQTPTVAVFSGKPVVLAAGGKKLMGVNPVDGKVYFEFLHGGGNGSAMSPVLLGEGKVLLTLDDRFSKTVQLNPQTDDKIQVSESWQERSIKNTYNIPVLAAGGVFAYSTRILTCVDPETGRAFWKTRKPGDGFLISVDGHLIINTKKGSLHLAKASKEGYQEISQLPLFEDLVWSIPAYSDNSVFVRSLGEIARVDIVSENKTGPIAASNQLPMGADFQEFVNRVNQATEPAAKAKQVDDWLASQTQFPVIEKGIAHFIYRGDHNDVALAGDFFGARQEKQMLNLEGTDLFYYTMPLEPDQRANYCYLINFKPTLDPLNQRKMTSTMYAGEMEFAVRLPQEKPLDMSWFAMPEWKNPTYLEDQDSLKGRLVEHVLNEEDQAKKTTIEVYLPPSVGAENLNRYPVAYVFDGKNAMERGDMVNAVDQLFGANEYDVPETIVVFLNGGGPGFTETLVNEIVPFVDGKYPTKAARDSRLVIGFGFQGASSLLAASTKNDIFGIASAQSPLAFADAERAIMQTMGAVTQPTQVHIQWGRFDMFNPHENWDIRTVSKAMYEKLDEIEALKMSGGMVNDSTDWSSWKNRYHEIFGLLKK